MKVLSAQRKMLTIVCFPALCLASASIIRVDSASLFQPKEAQAWNLKDKILSTEGYSSGLSDYKDFKTAYFDNLTRNFGANYKGSCGYVAIGMLLSYYDTYLDDSIVPEAYDAPSIGYGTNMVERRNSPGIRKDYIYSPDSSRDESYGFSLTAAEYYAAMKSEADSSLHAKLIDIGASLGFYQFDNDDSPCGLTTRKELNILSYYLNNVICLTEGVDYEILSIGSDKTEKDSDVKTFAINEIKNGNPVLLGIDSPGGLAHAVVAYDYDENSENIYCHMGWDASSTHVTPEQNEFTCYFSACSIHFKKQHSHTANYGVVTVDGGVPETSYHCYDDCAISTYHLSGAHDYGGSFEPHDAGSHKALCKCGAYELRAHGVKASSVRLVRGRYVGTCEDCLAAVSLSDTKAIQPLSLAGDGAEESGEEAL